MLFLPTPNWPIRFILPDFICSMKLVVPDFAKVPKFYIRSYLVIPIPESSIVRVFNLSS